MAHDKQDKKSKKTDWERKQDLELELFGAVSLILGMIPIGV